MRFSARFTGLFLCLIAWNAGFCAAESAGLYDSLRRRPEVKVYVAVPENPAGVPLDPALFRQEIEKAFQERKSIHFKPVPSAAEADLELQTKIVGFQYSEKDPVDMLVGVGAAAIDALKEESYAGLEADFSVHEKGAVIWKDRLRATITRAGLQEAEARQLILARAAENLMRRAFGKSSRR